MRVRITLEFTDDAREAINHHFGRPGKATHEEVKRWISYAVSGEIDSLMFDKFGCEDDESSS